MTSQSLRVEERAAAAIVAWEVGGWWVPRDVPGAPQGTHDVEVCRVDLPLIALEVTSAGDRSINELEDLLFDGDWSTPGLRHDWWLGANVKPRPDLKAIRRHVERHLRVLEELDVQEVNEWEHELLLPGAASELSQAAQAIFALRVPHARRLGEAEPGQAQLVWSLGSGFSTSPTYLNTIVERCAVEKAGKLLAAACDERHLFVWLRADEFSRVELVLGKQGPPDAPPTLPNGIDSVWVALGPFDPGAPALALWRVSPGSVWEQVRAPSQ